MEKHTDEERRKRILRIGLLLAEDVVLLHLASFLALWVRLDFSLEQVTQQGYLELWKTFAPVSALVILVLLAGMKLYTSLWLFAGVEELARIVVAGGFVVLLETAAVYAGALPLPRSFPLLHGMFLTMLIAASRFAYRILRMLMRDTHRSLAAKKRTMLIGAGEAGILALRAFQSSGQSVNRVVCIVDDDPRKRGRHLRGVPVVGGRRSILRAAQKYRVEEIVVAIPGAKPRERREIVDLCQQTGCRLKTLPGLIQLANGEVTVQKIRDVDVQDLLGRDSVQVDLEDIAGYLQGKAVLVTGGGGSIGSELCRQIAKHQPRQLVIFDVYENNAYAIQQELRRRWPELQLAVCIGSVRDRERVAAVMTEFAPELVFHAAAHKHVPLMEDSPNEAIKNNVFGTLCVARAAEQQGAERFVLISTDKAVNPTNVMGASKRLCEMIVQVLARRSRTRFAAVRFGNVLGSNGSVIPLFREQIAAGGPVTVTHRDIIRYFMTIPEAVSLVLQAGAYAGRGEIFVLDMGEPVRIDELARKMIRLSGLEPGVDIEIQYTGLRPGEKLYEELLMKEEGMRATPNKLIHIGRPLELDEEAFWAGLEGLEAACEKNDPNIRELVARLVHTYRPGQDGSGVQTERNERKR